MQDDPKAASAATDTRGLGDSALQSVTLESLTSARNYHRWLTGLARPHLGEHPVELGSGLGDYAETWLADGLPSITLTELDPVRLSGLQRRFEGDGRVEAISLDVFDPPSRQHSSLVAFNVLEHIDDDSGALSSAHRLLRPGGRVIMFVPAFPFAMGEFDRKVGHFRRYRKRTLRAAYEAAGLVVDDIRYINAPGLFAWSLGVRLLRMTPSDSPLVRLWDRLITPAAMFLERRVQMPFGQSLLAVGHVPTSGGSA